MNITVLKSKIHRAYVTDVQLDYEGSCAIDPVLMEAANIREYEQIHIWNRTNGARIVTYAIAAEESGTGIISVRGGAGHYFSCQDIVIIATFGQINTEVEHHPIKVYVDDKNQIK